MIRSSSSSAKGWGRASLLLAGILCVVYVPIFLGKVIHYRDMAYWSFPVRAFVKQALLSGQSPAWNPLQGLGLPTYADPLYGLHYPPNLLYLILPLPEGITWVAFLHLVWGGCGMLLLARRFGLSWLAGLVAALAWTLGGFNTSAWTAGLLLPAASWIPWCAVGITRLVARSSEGWRATANGVVVAAIPIAMSLLLGELFYSIMAVGFALVCGAILAAFSRQPSARVGAAEQRQPAWIRLSCGAVLAVSLGALAGAVTYVPAMAGAGGTERARPLKREAAEMCSVAPKRLIETVAPGSMGKVHESYPGYQWAGDKCVSKLPLVFSIYFGASIAGLALIALGRGRRLAAVLAGAVVFSLLVSMGGHTPVHDLFRGVVRPFAYMRYPEKYLALVFAFLALLAGLGAERVLASAAQPWKRAVVLSAGLLAWAAVAPSIVAPQIGAFMRDGAMMGAVGAALVSGVQLLMPRRPRVGSGMLVAAVAIDLAAACWPIQGFGPASVARYRAPGLEMMLKDYGDQPVPLRFYRARETDASVGRFVRVEAVQQGEFRASQAMIAEPLNAVGVATVPGYDAAIPKSLVDLWSAGKPMGQATMRLLGVNYAVMPVDNPLSHDELPHLSSMADPLPGARLYRVDEPLPRAYLAGAATIVADDRVNRLVFAPDVLSGGRVLLAADEGARALQGAAQRAGECRILRYTTDRIELTCDASRPAVAVLVDQWSPGWSARVDGVTQPLLRANGTSRAVFVARGEHRIEMSYVAPGVRVARMLSAAAVLALIAILAAIRATAPREIGVAGPL